MLACAPVCWRSCKLLLGNKVTTINTLELLLIDFVTARFFKAGELLFHLISSDSLRIESTYGVGVLSTLDERCKTIQVIYEQ